jgi:hypothetical protein
VKALPVYETMFPLFHSHVAAIIDGATNVPLCDVLELQVSDASVFFVCVFSLVCVSSVLWLCIFIDALFVFSRVNFTLFDFFGLLKFAAGVYPRRLAYVDSIPLHASYIQTDDHFIPFTLYRSAS